MFFDSWHFPGYNLNWDFIISCIDYCLSLLISLPHWGTLLLEASFYNANLSVPLSFWRLPTASGQNFRVFSTGYDLSWPGLFNSSLHATHMVATIWDDLEFPEATALSWLLPFTPSRRLTSHCSSSSSPARHSLSWKRHLSYRFLLRIHPYSRQSRALYLPEFSGCPGPAPIVTLPDYNYQFKCLFCPLYYKPFLGFYVFLYKSPKLAQCLAPEQT